MALCQVYLNGCLNLDNCNIFVFINQLRIYVYILDLYNIGEQK